jgi:chaperonin GroES
MIIPLLHRILLKPDPVEEISAGGIVLPKDLLEKERKATEYATVVAIGDTAFVAFSPPSPPLAVGDRVVIARYSGKEIEEDGNRYIVINDEDILVRLGE